MNKEQQYIRDICRKMEVGQRVCISRRIFENAYPCGFPSIYRTPKQAFLSSMVGSAWGGWGVHEALETGDIVISKHKESDKRYYVDPDREHLFKRMPDGTLNAL